MIEFCKGDAHFEKANVMLSPNEALAQLKPATILCPDSAQGKQLSRMLVKDDSGTPTTSLRWPRLWPRAWRSTSRGPRPRRACLGTRPP